jgi:hypothetical protein
MAVLIGTCDPVEVEKVWIFDRLAVAVAFIDFLDPALADEPDARERGVRIEVKPLTRSFEGTVYSSSTDALTPAVCRMDLLESTPHAADRMHWHPTMPDGEPGDRTFDAGIPADPIGWVSAQLGDLRALLERAQVEDVDSLALDADAVRSAVPEIAEAVATGLAWARQSPWPAVTHDERGLA